MNRILIDVSIEAGAWENEAVLSRTVQRAVNAAAESAGLEWPEGAELSLVFTDDLKISRLNEEWRQKPVPTNILSFPGADVAIGEPAGQILGDLVLSYETIAREAEEQDKAFTDHLTHLVIHGFLHLFGYRHDDESEANLMESIEKKALARLGISDPYAYL